MESCLVPHACRGPKEKMVDPIGYHGRSNPQVVRLLLARLYQAYDLTLYVQVCLYVCRGADGR